MREFLFANGYQSLKTKILAQPSDSLKEGVVALGGYHQCVGVHVSQHDSKYFGIAARYIDEYFFALRILIIKEVTKIVAKNSKQLIAAEVAPLSVKNYLFIHLPVFFKHSHIFMVFEALKFNKRGIN